MEGDAQVLIAQLSNSNDLADWIIEEAMQYIRSRVQYHPNWNYQWTPREANTLWSAGVCGRMFSGVLLCLTSRCVAWGLLYLGFVVGSNSIHTNTESGLFEFDACEYILRFSLTPEKDIVSCDFTL